jgi:protein-L-isoaspartate(D-aspartate) O-methyltransferase
MVREQLVPRGINDPAVLASMREVPRHLFVPPHRIQEAYEDTPLPIGYKQVISQPYLVGIMAQLADLDAHSSVLEIGTGSGYAAAVLGGIVKTVYTIERIPELSEQAQKTLQSLGYHNVHVRTGDGSLGWAEKAPFDAIISTAGAATIPQSFLDQIKVGGKIVMPLGELGSQYLVRIRLQPNKDFTQEYLDPVRFVPLIGEQGWPAGVE